MAKILVTGAGGFIGSHTVDQLLADGHSVWGVDNFRTGRMANLAEALRQKHFSLHEFDATQESNLFELISKIRPDVVIHLAALVSVPESVTNPALNDRLNFQATCIIAEAARRIQVPRVVFASSAAVYGGLFFGPIPEDAPKKPLSPYGSAKLASEKLLHDYARKFGFTVRCQRYFNVYGPRQDPRSSYSGVISLFVDHVKHCTAPVIYGDGEQTRDFVSVHDVARANVIAATSLGIGSGTVNICTGLATSVNSIWQLLATYRPNSPRPSYASARHGDIRHSCGRPDAAQRELNFAAKTIFSAGIAELVDS